MKNLTGESEKYWKKKLTPEQYKILREKGTEPAFTGKLLGNHEDGMYHCAACSAPLFSSDTKFESGSGWPSFWDAVNKKNLELAKDTSYSMMRTEVMCAKCGSHLGHLFADGPTALPDGRQATGARYCINSASLKFSPSMFLLIDKPKGITSHDVVDEVRRITSEKRVGHAGTLDPNATGLLIVGIGRESTKKLGELSRNTRKKYIAEIYLGEERETDDSEGRILRQAQDDKADLKILPALSNSKVEKVIHSFVGEQRQVPPTYSAIKIKGKKAYELARKGEEFKLKPRKITIHSIKLISYNYPQFIIETDVSSGTYIRALARDIGVKLGCGAYLKNLRRTRIGKYDIKIAIALDKLDRDNWKKFVRVLI